MNISEEFVNRIFEMDCIKGMKQLPDNSVDCCITSPPYYGLRDYGMEGQLGLERTPGSYIAKMVEVFTEVKRVLKPHGTLWLNIGDSYASHGSGSTPNNGLSKAADLYSPRKNERNKSRDERGEVPRAFNKKIPAGLKPKDLIGIPWMLAFALRNEGFYLRQDIIWAKPNPMPESVTDRCTKSHEYIFLLSKSQKYFYDAEAIKTDAINPVDDARRSAAQTWDNKNTPDEFRNGIRPRKSGNLERKAGSERGCPEDSGSNVASSVPWEGTKANKRSVWTVNSAPYADAHFATFPEKLITDCIKAGCPENGIILDPFMGAGTTAMVARKLYRNFIGYELNPEYVSLANNRLEAELGLFI